MVFYVYFDSYGYPRRVIRAEDLADKYNNDPNEFFNAVNTDLIESETQGSTGHVGTLSFDNEQELHDYLDSLGDEVEGFFCCRSDSRPYNF